MPADLESAESPEFPHVMPGRACSRVRNAVGTPSSSWLRVGPCIAVQTRWVQVWVHTDQVADQLRVQLRGEQLSVGSSHRQHRGSQGAHQRCAEPQLQRRHSAAEAVPRQRLGSQPRL